MRATLGDHLRRYLARGWNPMPLPPGQKFPPPRGYTGHRAKDVTEADVLDWLVDDTNPDSNVALRMPDGVLGLDVDVRTGGHETMRHWEEELGPLPVAPVSNSRDDEGGIRFFRVPIGVVWVADLGNGSGVETIQRHHRYAVVEPSIHPTTGQPYRWSDGAPHVEALPDLPGAWVKRLTKKPDERGSVDPAKLAHATDAQRQCARDEIADLARQVRELHEGDRHTGLLTRANTAGGYAAWLGVDGVRETISLLTDAGQSIGLGADEAASTAADGVSFGVLSPLRLGMPEDDFEPVEDDSEPVSPIPGLDLAKLRDAEGRVFGASPVLAAVRSAARGRLVSPWAVLGSVLARVLVDTPVPVVLPPTIGTVASLNFAVALVGPSGFGKTTGNGLAGELLDTPEAGSDASDRLLDRLLGYRPVSAGVGSGEGIVQSFLQWQPGADGAPGSWVLRDYPHTLMVADEVATLDEAGKSRSGSTLGSVLRKALTGDALTTTNATRERNRRVDAKTYRFCLVVGVQPDLSDALLNEADAASGTPQRFLWLPAVDPFMTAAAEPWEGGIGWAGPTWPDTGEVRLSIPAEARDLIVSQHIGKNRGRAVGLNGHTNLTRLKVAAALALLHEQTAITSEWWGLAGVLLGVSDMTRAACQKALAERSSRNSAQRGRLLGVQAAHAARSQAEQVSRATRRYAVLVWKAVVAHTEPEAINRKHPADAGCTRRCVTFALRNHKDKGIDPDAVIEDAVSRGWIERDGERLRPGDDHPNEDRPGTEPGDQTKEEAP